MQNICWPIKKYPNNWILIKISVWFPPGKRILTLSLIWLQYHQKAQKRSINTWLQARHLLLLWGLLLLLTGGRRKQMNHLSQLQHEPLHTTGGVWWIHWINCKSPFQLLQVSYATIYSSIPKKSLFMPSAAWKFMERLLNLGIFIKGTAARGRSPSLTWWEIFVLDLLLYLSE